MNDTRRNFDILLIGTNATEKRKIKFDASLNILDLTQKRCGMFASYLFLIHNYSYLREDGKGMVYIITDNINDNTLSITEYNIFCFHPVIRMKMNATSKLMRKFPILYYFRSFKNDDFFIKKKEMSIKERINFFCKERKLNAIYIN